MLTQRWIAACMVVVTVLSLLAACGPAPTPQATQEMPEATPTVEQEAQITPTPTGPRQGGTLVVPLTADVNFNSILATGPNDSYIQATIFNGLVRADKETMEPSPDLAESWEVSEDGLTWTFHLRKDVKWHDGEPFTAEDVKFHYDQGLFDEDVNSQIRSALSDVIAVEVVDEHTVQFILKAPWVAFLSALAEYQFIVPKHILEGQDLNTYDEFNKLHAVGTGPFKLEEVAPGDHYTVVANEDYFGGRPYLDSIVFKVIPDPNVRVAQLKTGEVDLAVITPANLAALASEHDILMDYVDKLQFYGVYLNNARSPFDDPRVRQAMIYGLDRQAIIDAVSGGTWIIATGPIHPRVAWAYNADVPVIPYDPEKAKELLAEAGWNDSDGDGILDKDDQPCAFTLTVDNDPVRNQSAVIAQQYYKALGMDVELEVLEWGTLLSERYFSRNYDSLVIYATMSADPDQRVYFATDAPDNRWNYSNPEVDQLLEEGARESDTTKRQEVYYRYQEIMAFEDPPMVFLFYPKEIRAYTETLTGLPDLAYLHSWRYVAEWWLDE